MVVLILIAFALAPALGSGGDCCPSGSDDGGVIEAAFRLGDEGALGEGPCDTEDTCPSSGGCCAVCVGCCKTALRSSSSSGTARGVTDTSPSMPLRLPVTDPGCSVWHPPRG